MTPFKYFLPIAIILKNCKIFMKIKTYLQNDGGDGEVALAMHGGHDAEDGVEKKGRNAEEKQQIVEQ